MKTSTKEKDKDLSKTAQHTTPHICYFFGEEKISWLPSKKQITQTLSSNYNVQEFLTYPHHGAFAHMPT